ncbi:MAG: DUF6094 domain-containing protein [bacterium]
MARPGSVEVGGYFPTPESILPRIASLITWPRGSHRAVLLDPCAGDGHAILTLRRLWGASEHAYLTGPSIVACEAEAERAKVLRGALHPHRDQTFSGDAFSLLPTVDPSSSGGAAVLYLNPPYDHDPEYQRLEHRFLTRFTEHLAAGAGYLLFLVPYRALSASAAFLGAHYAELRSWRLPDPEFQAFGQVLVLGRRRPEPIERADTTEALVRRWARDPSSLPVLPERAPDPVEVSTEHWFRLEYRMLEADLETALGAFEPWPGPETGADQAATDLLGAKYPVACPPKPAHIALALAAGMFNGHRLDPDDPTRFPPILAKGTYSREPVELDRTSSTDGVESVITVDRPRLRVTVLRLDTSSFHTLAEGTEPAGGDDLDAWTAADLLIHYGRSMASLLQRQFPPLHDPADPGGRLPLPDLPRRLYRVQEESVHAALKLLASARNPFVTAEVGTGKTTVALYIAVALSPKHHSVTANRLRQLDLDHPIPVVRRTLVVCPPHLLKGWSDQAREVVPDARIQTVRRPEDLDADADLYILSREAAKLGHGHQGLEGACPACAASIPRRASTNASRRLRCKATLRRPANLEARLAVHLAALLAHSRPDDDLVVSLAPPRLQRAFAKRGSQPLPSGLLRELQHSVWSHLESVTRDLHLYVNGYSLLHALVCLLDALHSVLGADPSPLTDRLQQLAHETDIPAVTQQLQDAARRMDHRDVSPGQPQHLLTVLELLHERATWHADGTCDEPLFQATPPRRIPLAKVILRRHRRRFDLVILDEAHEYNQGQSAQSKAAHRLTGLPGVLTVVLTGSLMGGYASSLFTNFHALSPPFREEFRRDDATEFVARYGYRKIRLTTRGSDAPKRGSHTDRELVHRRVVGEAPGIHPLFLMRYLLPTAVIMHKADLDQELPPLTETPVALAPPEGDVRATELLTEYHRLQEELLDHIRRDRNDPDLAGRLLGALVELPSYLDRATDDLAPFEIRYPESVGGAHIATGTRFPAIWRTPKERWLLHEIEHRRAAGERVVVFLRHTRSPLPQRLLRLVQTVAPSAVWLDTRKVPTHQREAWIDEHVNEPDVPILLVNPNAVRTGLNNLTGFSTAIWHELDSSAFVYRQAIGRFHRIGQERPVTILIPFYKGTAQEILFELVARKISASLQVDGLDVRAALEAAGAGDHSDGLDAALSLGRAIHRRLTH